MPTNDSESSDSEDDLPCNQDTGNHNKPPGLTNNTDDNQLPTDARIRPANTHEPVLTGTFKPFTKGMGNAKKRTAGAVWVPRVSGEKGSSGAGASELTIS